MVSELGKELRPLFQRNGGIVSIHLYVIETGCFSRILIHFDMRDTECGSKTESGRRLGAPWN